MVGLYIHIPFCVKKCKYCDFNSYSGLDHLQTDYFTCLKKEIDTINKDVIFDTVYIGGGTPTAVNNEYLVKLINSIKNRTKDCEVTIECNPGTVNIYDLENLKKAGANRLSIGLQSTNDDELKVLGRIHTLKDFEECFSSARKVGFENISIDIMFGLPKQTVTSFKETISKAVSYNSEHISCYCLKIEDGTPFSKMDLILPNDDETADMYDCCVDFLEENGYKRYEISNFAKNNKISRHNIKYWQLDGYIGIGAGAHSFYKSKRFSKICNVKEYIDSITLGKDGILNCEIITEQEKMKEFVFLGLRMTEGIDKKRFFDMFKKDIFDIYKNQLEKYLKLGVLEDKNGKIFIKSKYLYVSNHILSDFI